jgi:hypothetical protein
MTAEKPLPDSSKIIILNLGLPRRYVMRSSTTKTAWKEKPEKGKFEKRSK